ncbi:IS110 family transposase [Nocardia vinacea]|uniref:IS110 family transposase n=1 Tax=Nocardia vinacea TaxID=96468 RepID=UPI000A0125B4|nr:transposase [Nocardia vinacea]
MFTSRRVWSGSSPTISGVRSTRHVRGHRAPCAHLSTMLSLSPTKVNDRARTDRAAGQSHCAPTDRTWPATSGRQSRSAIAFDADPDEVVYVRGRMVAAMTGIFRGEGKIAKDARVIAESARMHADLQPLIAPDELVAELTRLSSYRSDLVQDWVRGVNQLRDVLAAIFPPLEAAFDYSTRSPPILISRFCTPTEMPVAGIDCMTTHLTGNRAWLRSIDNIAATAVAARAGHRRPRGVRPPHRSNGRRGNCSTWTARSRTSTNRSPPGSENTRDERVLGAFRRPRPVDAVCGGCVYCIRSTRNGLHLHDADYGAVERSWRHGEISVSARSVRVREAAAGCAALAGGYGGVGGRGSQCADGPAGCVLDPGH